MNDESTPPISPGLYVPPLAETPRYVLGVIGGYVRYSRGGDHHYMCQVKTFKRWLRANSECPAQSGVAGQ